MACRSVQRVVPTTRLSNGFHRVIGSTDFTGEGTDHELGDVNPFVLLDGLPGITKAHMPPFGVHPHYGLQVASLGWCGSIRSRLASDPEGGGAVLGTTGGSYVAGTFAGRGACHDETTITDELTRLSQLAWLIPEARREDDPYVDNLDELKPKVLDDGKVSAIDIAASGMFDGHPEASARLTLSTEISIVMAVMEPGGRLEIPHTCAGGSFVYPTPQPDGTSARISVCGQEVPEHSIAVLHKEAGAVWIVNDGDTKADVLFAAGQEIDEPWVKLLHANGFLIAKDADTAKAKAAEFDAVGALMFGTH